MKKVHLVSLFFLLSLLAAFRPTVSPNQIIDGIKVDYKQKLDALNEAIENLQVQVARFETSELSKEDLEKTIVETRLTYKQIEHFLEYFQGEAITRYINGAPLPKVDPSAPEHSVIPPLGLQTLDESIFAEEVDAEEVVALAKELKLSWGDIYKFTRTFVLIDISPGQL